ncbi:hypothetical protein PZA11_007494 [Diplocarpon coronariae]|uniref:Rhodopsin domain-containing protein n=1 Tax=Diplocarpon coronariae TaxID=2795749 RepID=A0A218Z0R1_9HELO|nr:hypothetical protein JHW43_008730 [Diplocarpon mali]OWP00826.1 hypothetical protein B2J93_5360 [Marssonina coronariae]
MQIPPPEVVASWPVQNLVNPETRGMGNVVLNIVLYTLLLSFVALRIFTRTQLKNAFGVDDTFILCALLPTTGFFTMSILKDTKYLWVRHTYDIPPSHVVGGLKLVMAAEVTFAAAITLTKLSMLMLVKRLLASASLFWRRITLLAIAIVTIQGSVFCLTILFQCRPMQDYWKITKGPQPNCIDQPATLLSAGIINTLTDILTVLLPIRTISTLQLPRRQMAIVILLFGFGFISCIAGIIRTYFMYEVTTGWDQTWRSYPVWITSALELYIGIICASIPATKPFFSTYLPEVFGSMTSSFSNSHYQCPSRCNRSQTQPSSHDGELLDLEKQLGVSGARKRGINETVISRLESRDCEAGEVNGECIMVVQTFETETGRWSGMSGRR